MAIEALMFDLGKVLIDFDFELGMRHFAPRSGLSTDALWQVILDRRWIDRYEKGAISTEEYHHYLRDAGQLDMDLEEFQEAWTAVFLPEPIVPEAFLASLRERYPLILVSNINESHATHIATNYSVFDHFDHRILSHEVGAMKPERKIYDVAIAAAGKPAESLFFTDDREENVESALKMGIRAHQFRSLSGLIAALKECGVDTGAF